MGSKPPTVKSVLPIDAYEQQIVDTVASNRATIVIGATGSGKTTQIAQFLHRAGYTDKGMVGVSQPRRVAAVTVARRVASEMGVTVGEEVGYSVRFEDRMSAKTRIGYFTDGCLLRECLADPEMRKFSVIVLDEAHERSLNTDILFGLLKKLSVDRKPELKLVITSATLDSQKFSDFFLGCPVIDVPGRLHPVEILHSTEKAVKYLESTVDTILHIHNTSPPGDILAFLTGQEEIETAVRMLEERIAESDAELEAVLLPLHASLPPQLQSCEGIVAKLVALFPDKNRTPGSIEESMDINFFR